MRANITLPPKQLGMAVASVALGGGVGTLLRALALRIQDAHWFESLLGTLPHNGHVSWWGHVPWILELINVAGVYLATRILVGPLRNHDPNDLTRLLVITGFLGGFTSYSSLFVSLAEIWHQSVPASLSVGILAVLSGVGAGWLGIRHGHR
jgi:fluoride ion exporter CrcB/FEX